MITDFEKQIFGLYNYDDICIYFRDIQHGVRAEKWLITNSDADEFGKGDLIIIYSGGIARADILAICGAFPNDFCLGSSYTDETGENVQVNHIRFKPSPKTSTRQLSDWLTRDTTAPVVCGNCKNLDKCAGGSDIERATILDRDASQCIDFE